MIVDMQVIVITNTNIIGGVTHENTNQSGNLEPALSGR